MAFNHGITATESPTKLLAAVSDSITPVYVGTAPINLCKERNINEPILCSSYAEAVENFGFLEDFESYTLCEAIDVHFSKFNIGPIILINVVDTTKHIKEVTNKTITFVDGKYLIEDIGVLPETVVITTSFEYTKFFNDKGQLVLIPKETKTDPIEVRYSVIDIEKVKETDIIGGIDGATGKKKGLEAIAEVFPKYRKVPSLILAPKYSSSSTVAAVIEAKARKINGHFQGLGLVDLDTSKVKKYGDTVVNKNTNNISSTFLDVSWPKISLGKQQYNISTQKAALIQMLAKDNEDIPYRSPSNKNIKGDGAVLIDGTPVRLGLDEANYLNSQGISTIINWTGGWRLWGNRTSCYPAVSDPKDAFIVSRMMFNWVINSLVLTYWQKIDEPTNKVLIETVTDSINIWLNGLVAAGKLIGARVEFRREDNPLTSLVDGKIKFKLYFTPALPAEEIKFDLEIDVKYYEKLF